MNFFAFIDFINIFIAVFLGLDILSKDRANKLNKMFFVNSMIAAYTAFCEYFRLTAVDFYWAYFWHKASFLWTFFPFMFLGMILQIADKKYVTNNRVKLFFVLPALIISAIHLFTDVLYEGLYKSWYGWDFKIAHNLVSALIPIYFLIVGVFSILIIIRHYRAQIKEREKRKALFALIGLSIPTLAGFASEGLLPMFAVDLPPVNSILYIVGSVFIYISILKYDFLKLDPNDTVNKLFETSVDYMMIFDKEGNIIQASKSLLNACEYEQLDLIGNNIGNIFENPESPLEISNQEIFDKEFELYLRTKSGQTIPTSVTITKVGSVAQNEYLCFLTARDLRERKQFENQLLSMQKSLEDKVNQRTIVLSKVNEKLRDEITMRIEAENKISKALTEKETLLKEIHHRVKNNLQIISSLLYLQSQKTKDPVSNQILQESQNRIRTMALVHEHLYSHNDFSQINFTEYIKDLYQFISSNYEGTTDLPQAIFELEDVNLPLELTIPLGLILNELFINLLKYAFKNQPDIRNDGLNKFRVKLKSNGNKNFILTVGDNGVGLPENFETIDSLGFKLMKSLVDQIAGKIEYQSGDWKEFIINFSLQTQNERINT
jgi:PAS domain S-box-containing protein